MRHLPDVGTPFRTAARDLTLAGNRIGVAATAVALAATLVIAIVAPV